MTKIIASLALAAATGLGLAGTAQAAPVPTFAGGANFHDRSGVSIGVGFGGGGGYYRSHGYWATGYRTVQRTWIAGYDAWRRPIYQSGWVQEPYQYWVSAPRYSYGPTVRFGFRFGR